MKSLKNLIIPFVFLVLLIVATVLWLIIRPSGEDVSSNLNLEVFKVSLTEVSEIIVHKANDEDFSVKTTYDPNIGLSWAIVDDDSSDTVTYSQDKFTTWAAILTDFKANSLVIENPTNLDEYGLETPLYTIEIIKNDGSVHKVYMGNETNDSSYVYFMCDDNPAVYTVAIGKLMYADNTAIDFIDSCVYRVDYNNIKTVQFERNTEDSCNLIATCKMEDTGKPSYYIISPFSIEGSDTFRNLIQYAGELDVSKFINLSDDEIKNYGLDNPTFHFLFTMMDGEIFELYLSKNIGGYFYGYTNITEGYFSISELQFEGLETPTMMLLFDYINYFNASVIKSIVFTSDDVNFDFEINTKRAIGDEDAVVKIDLRSAKVKTSEGRTYAALLFETLTCIKINGIDLEVTPELVSDINIKFCYNNYTQKIYDFVSRDDFTYYVFLDGEYTGFYVLKSEFTYDNGADLDGTKYGIIPAYNILNVAIDNQLNEIYDIPASEE